MTSIWAEQAKLDRWLAIELAACDGFVALGRMPAETVARHASADIGSGLES